MSPTVHSSQAVMRCLEKKREARFEDIGALAAAIDEFASLDARGTSEQVIGVLDATNPHLPHPHLPPAGDGDGRRDTVTVAIVDSGTRRRRRVIGTAFAGLVLCAAVGGTIVATKAAVGSGGGPVPTLAPPATPSTPALLDAEPSGEMSASDPSARAPLASADAARSAVQAEATNSEPPKLPRKKSPPPRPRSSRSLADDASATATATSPAAKY